MVSQSCHRIPAASIAGRFALPLLALAAVLACPSDALANCLGGATTRTVNPAENLADIIERSTPPCTITVNAGTYAAQNTTGTGDQMFRLSTGITVRSASGPGSTTLSVAGGKPYTLIVQPLFGTQCPNGATLEGFTLQGGNQG